MRRFQQSLHISKAVLGMSNVKAIACKTDVIAGTSAKVRKLEEMISLLDTTRHTKLPAFK